MKKLKEKLTGFKAIVTASIIWCTGSCIGRLMDSISIQVISCLFGFYLCVIIWIEVIKVKKESQRAKAQEELAKSELDKALTYIKKQVNP